MRSLGSGTGKSDLANQTNLGGRAQLTGPHAAPHPAPRDVDEAVLAREKIRHNMEVILQCLGEDPGREGLKETPQRYAKAIEFLTSGYRADIQKIVGNALFKDDTSEMVLVRDIEFFSLCEHHLLPFWGRAHVAYLPNGRIIGLSKIPRIVDMFARRLQVQERLTNQVSQTLMKILDAQGVAVVIEASHMCMMMRGVEKQNSLTTTSSMQGAFRENPATRQEFMSLVTKK